MTPKNRIPMKPIKLKKKKKNISKDLDYYYYFFFTNKVAEPTDPKMTRLSRACHQRGERGKSNVSEHILVSSSVWFIFLTVV